METWQEYYEKHKNNINETVQSLWFKYNDYVYYGYSSGNRNRIKRDNTTNDYIDNDYVDDYLE